MVIPKPQVLTYSLLGTCGAHKVTRCSRIKQYNDRAFIEEERTYNHFLSSVYLLHNGVVGAAKPWRWAPLLVHHRHWSMR
jgi:hypothetical protein